LRVQLYTALLKQEMDFFGATRSGDVSSRLSADCQKVSDQVQLNVNVFLRSLIQIFFTLGFMISINFNLALVCFVVVPAIVAVTSVFGSYMRPISTETQDALANANANANEVLGAVATMRAFAAESEESDRYADAMSKYVHMCYRQARLYFFYSSLTYTFLPYCAYALVLFCASQLVHKASIDGAGLISFVIYMQTLFGAFNSVGDIFTSLATAIGASDKVIKWIERTPGIGAPTTPLAPPTCRGDVRLDGVTFRYALRPEKRILDGLSLHAAPGEVVALCGPSGGGKSTVISLVERFYTPENGQVYLDDIPISDLDPRWFHRQVALVGQEPVLFGRSLTDNICYGLLDAAEKPASADIVSAATLANAHGFISGFENGYMTHVGERGAQLSGGQKQRIAIARALVRKPAVLLLDEATSALDAESEHVVQAAIDTMISHQSMTVLVIAHRLSTIRNADRILVISGGRVSESGAHAELLGLPNGEYAKLVARQMQGSNGSRDSSKAASALDMQSLQH